MDPWDEHVGRGTVRKPGDPWRKPTLGTKALPEVSWLPMGRNSNSMLQVGSG